MNPLQDLQAENGGRPAANDDFLVLQGRDAVLGLPALLSGLGPCVVSGCRLWQTGNQWNVGPGMVWDGSNLLPFTGRSNVTLPAMFAPGAVVVVDERAYQTGGTKTTIKQQSMDLVAIVAGAPNLVVNTWGCLRWNDVVRASVRYVGELVDFGTLNENDFEGGATATTGLGKPGTPMWGFAKCNGNNNTPDLRAMFTVGYNTERGNDGRGHQLSILPLGAGGGQEQVVIITSNLPSNPAGTGDVATFVGPGNGMNLVPSGTNGWVGRPPRAGSDAPLDTRPPFHAVAKLMWVGY